MRDDLGIAARTELVPAPEELLPQLAEVVDLAVEDDGNGPVLVRDRRIAGDQIDDRQPVLPDHPLAADEGSPCVRPPVLDRGELGIDH